MEKNKVRIGYHDVPIAMTKKTKECRLWQRKLGGPLGTFKIFLLQKLKSLKI